MSVPWVWIIGCLTAYLLGAVPFGWLVSRARGIDIRTVGSGNIGATNVYRCVGKKWGILVFALDFLKGLAGCTLIPFLAARLAGLGDAPTGLQLAGGALAVAGHNWPVYLGFKGGKGVATSAGLLLGLAPAGCGIALAAWAVVLLATRYMSVASIAAAVVLGAVAWPLYAASGPALPTVLNVLAILVVLRHRANLRRLHAGTESRFSFRRSRPTA